MDLSLYVDAWAESADRTLALLDDLPAQAWTAPTGCPGWSVRDVVAHLAALESELAGAGLGGPSLSGVPGSELQAAYTEAGVRQRDGVPASELVTELREAVAVRRKALATLPEDPQAVAERAPGGLPWTNELLLRNRMIDVFVHEQDIRAAVGVPGGYEGRAGVLVVDGFLRALPYVLAKKVQAEPGTVLVIDLTGPVARTVTVEVGDDGRGRLHEGERGDASARITLTTQTFLSLVAGRDALVPHTVTWTGDSTLAGDLLAEIAVTP